MHLGSNRAGALAALTAAVVLSGCAKIEVDGSTPWFSKPLDLFGRSGGYSFSQLKEGQQQRPITANDLVDASGACPPLAAPPQTPSAADNLGANPPAAPDAASLLGGGVALGMSECDVVYRAGQPTALDLGKRPGGDRSVVLTYQSGPRPGVYRFVGGRLVEMDRVNEPQPPPEPAKKKPAKTGKPVKGKDAA